MNIDRSQINGPATTRIRYPQFLGACLGLLFVVTAGCGKEDPADKNLHSESAGGAGSTQSGESATEYQPSPREIRTLAWERSAYYASLQEWVQARTALAPILDENAQPADWVRAGIIEMQAGIPGKALEYLDKGQVDGKDGLAARYVKARLATMDFDSMEQARDMFESLLQDVPKDPATRYALGKVYEDMEPEEDSVWEANQVRAQELYRSILDEGLPNGGPWYVSALFRMYMISLDSEDLAAKREYEDAWKGLESIGAKAISVNVLNEGTLAKIDPPVPYGNRSMPVTGVPSYELRSRINLPNPGARHLATQDWNGDRLLDLIWLDEKGLTVCIANNDGGLEPKQIWTGEAQGFLTADLSRDGYQDVLLAVGSDFILYDQNAPAEEGGTTELSKSGIQVNLPAPPKDMTWVDYDHDGDLDVLCVGEFGLRILRNDGAGRIPERDLDQTRGGFADVTETLGVNITKPLTWCEIEDFDADQDVDFLVGGPGVTLLASSLRSGLFEDRTSQVFPKERPDEYRPNLMDLDGNGRVDFLFRDASGFRIHYQGTTSKPQQLLSKPNGQPLQGDLDLDGQVDVIWPKEAILAEGFLAVGQTTRAPLSLAPEGLTGTTKQLLLAEMDRAQDVPIALELIRLTESGVEIWENPKPAGGGMRLRYSGKKDNPDAIGAVLEVRCGGLYRRVFYRGIQEIVGLGKRDYADVVRVTWPNGVRRSNLDIEAGDPFALDESLGIQTEGQIGSCPFLYTWNGKTFEFISDVLGITPLGLPMAPGMLVPPDNDEYVLIRGSQLKPRKGFYEMQFTEELREVTYLDRAQLLVIDHPKGTEFYPNERFCFPPFPDDIPHLFDTPIRPTRVIGSDGKDWTRALATIDNVHAAPAKPLTGQFTGLSEPHWLEVSFDRQKTQGAERLRLVCTGWVYWTDASVNMATARTPDLDFVPPIILVPEEGPDGEQWVPIGPPVGFPAGKTKTMVIDLAGFIDASNPRIRIQTSLSLYWDSLRLAVGDRYGEQIVTYIEPASAELWERGFSASIAREDQTQPEMFDWDQVATNPRWDQHPGMYTKLGPCLPLLQAIDDRFVIMGSGDALKLRFDAGQAPRLQKGYERDFLVFLDGWAKDRDPNTIEALAVEPLPFHGMGSYPYGPDKAFPSGEVHQRWRKEWNTRPSKRLIIPMAQEELAEWLDREAWPAIAPTMRQK